MSSTLNDLDSFLKRIEPGIEAITGEEQDIASFMRLMRVFNEVGSREYIRFIVYVKRVTFGFGFYR